MGEVRADDDVLAALAGQISGHVGYHLRFAPHVDGGLQGEVRREGETGRLQVLVDRCNPRFQVLAGGREPLVGDTQAHLDEGDLAVTGADQRGEAVELVGVGMVGQVVDENDRFGAVELGVDGLVVELRMAREHFAGENALVVELLRLVAQHDHDFVFHVQPGVVVVAVLGRADAVAGEDQRPGKGPVGREVERPEILAQGGRMTLGAAAPGQAVVRAEAGIDRHFVALDVVLTGGRRNARLLVLLDQPLGRGLELGRAGHPPLHLRRGQVLDRLAVVRGGDGIKFRCQAGGGEDQRGEQSGGPAECRQFQHANEPPFLGGFFGASGDDGGANGALGSHFLTAAAGAPGRLTWQHCSASAPVFLAYSSSSSM